MQTETVSDGNAEAELRPRRSPSGSIQSVERAILLLKEFGLSGPELGVTEASKRLGLHKSTVSRLLGTLERGGFVEQISDTRRYRLGLQLASLAGLAVTQLDLSSAARPYLVNLAAQSEETATLSVLDGDEAVNIDQVPGPHPVKDLGWIGRRLPLHASAGGKPLLASLSAEQLERWLQQPLPAYTERTVTSPEQLRRELQEMLACGYVIVSEEYEPGLTAVGAPVYDYHREIVASITISGPTFRLHPEQLETAARLIKDTAERISARLGYTPQQTSERKDTRPYPHVSARTARHWDARQQVVQTGVAAGPTNGETRG
ncbi:MAG: IclR family transcriptional regulator [Chloroflexota bacterium]|nr:IclR family transcriptional regulator [Chloroflexota bacterium]